MSNKDHDITRRQFLNYSLTGVGGFMAASMLMPMVRFAVDPLLKEDKGSEFIQLDMKASEVSDTPVKKTFTKKTVDGWHEFKQEKVAYILKGKDGDILAMSPVCTHLGCTVGWEAGGHANSFYCPCHGGTYNKYGINQPGTPPPAPLHVYEVKVKDGYISLGEAHPRGGA